MADLFGFVVTATIILATPGPTNVLLATAAAASGPVRSLPLVAAALVAYLIAIFTIRLFWAPLAAMLPLLATGLRLAVAAYLVWLASRLWRRGPLAAHAAGSVSMSAVFLTTLLNPKALIFALTVFSLDDSTILLETIVFAVAVVLTGSVWIVLGHVLKTAAGERAHYIPRIAALALLGFAGYLVGTAV